MDKIIPKKKGLRRKHITWLAGGAAVLGAVLWLSLGNHSQMRVDAERARIVEAVQGEFNDFVRLQGHVQPAGIVHLTPLEGGIVAEKVVEEGAQVRAGDVIVRLSNPALAGQILTSETRLAEQENIQLNTRINMQQQKLQLERDHLSQSIAAERAKRRMEQYEKLWEERLIAREEWLRAREEWELAARDLSIIDQKQRSDSLLQVEQVQQMGMNLQNIRLNAQLERSRMEGLSVRAPVDGQLGRLDVEVGQWVGGGTAIGQISVLSDFKIEARVDEHYIDRVTTGLEGVFERGDRQFALRVRRVYPEVVGGQFKVDFAFEGERPDNIRAGQSYQIALQLGAPTEAVLVPRGAFYNTTGGQWIFVVSADGHRAQRREIVIGRQNPSYYEVLSGLEPGERVIISSYENYGNAKELKL